MMEARMRTVRSPRAINGTLASWMHRRILPFISFLFVAGFFSNSFAQSSGPLQVIYFQPTYSGFEAQFRRPLAIVTTTDRLNLYGTETGGFGPADVTVIGATSGVVSGSLVVDSSGGIVFVKTGGPLVADTYTVTLRSASNGFKATDGTLLDGNGDGVAGDNYVTNFTISSSSSPVISIPNFTRGPGQPINVPTIGYGFPVKLSNGGGVTSVELVLQYNPAMLSIFGVAPGTLLPAGSQVQIAAPQPGFLYVTINLPTALGAGPIDLLRVMAKVPQAASYGATHILSFPQVQLNGGAINVVADDSIHVVAYFGDTTGNQMYNSLDAERLLRVVVGLDSGFASYLLVDPMLIGEITGNDILNSLDATRILQEVVGLDRLEIPPLPVTPIADAGNDINALTLVTINLDGSNSYDPDDSMVTFNWTVVQKPSGSNAILGDSSQPNPEFTPDLPGDYVFALTVNDGESSSLPDQMTVHAFIGNVPPNARAGKDRSARVGAAVTLDGSGSFSASSGNLQYLWSFVNLPSGSNLNDNSIASRQTASPVFTPDLAGIYILKLKVSQGSLFDEDIIEVRADVSGSVGPVANAGIDKIATTSSAVSLGGTSSFDPDNGPSPLSYSWTLVTRPPTSGLTSQQIANASSSTPMFTPDAEGSYILRLKVTDNAKISEDNVLVKVTPANRLMFITQPANVTAGSAMPGPLALVVRDYLGNTVTSPVASITIAIGNNPGGAVLGGTTTQNTASGVASFPGINLNKSGVGYTLTASAPGLIGAVSTPFTVTNGVATKLGFTTQPGNSTAGGVVFGPTTIRVQDALGNTVTNSTASITMSFGQNPGGGTLSGTKTKNAVLGMASFTDLSINQVATGYTLTASATGHTSATSSTFSISAGIAAKLAVTSVNGGNTPAAGAPFSVLVQSQNIVGSPLNVVTATAVSLSLKTGTGTLAGTLTGTISAGSNQVVISGTTYTRAESGVVITAIRTSGDALVSGNSAIFTVVSGTAASLAFINQPGNPVTGSSIPGPPSIALKDNFGNTVTSSTATVTIAIGTNPAGGTLSGTTSINATSGIATFSNLMINQPGTGYTLTASSTGLPPATSIGFTVSSSPRPDLVVSSVSSPPASVTAGSSFSVTDTTLNSGNASAVASETKYRLSLDATIDAADPILTGSRAVPSLNIATSSTGTITVTIPTNLPPGKYYLAACADDTGLIAEANEANNCRVSTITVQVHSVRDKGLAWMITHQQANGSWRSTSGTEVVTTATTIEAFNNAYLKNFVFASGLSWLANAPALSVDALSRQMSALGQSKVNVAFLLKKLIQWRNGMFTWGAYEGFETSFPDTPLAVSAILAGGLPYNAPGNALCAILPAQKTGDAAIAGSWSYINPRSTPPASAISSAILPTIANILALDAIRNTGDNYLLFCSSGQYQTVSAIPAAIDNGINWLLTQKKKSDGGFGQESSSTVLDTALVYPVLAALRASDAATSAALTYLVNSQAADGSWNNDALQTAFVLKALPPASGPSTDSDGDGIPDTIEIILGTNPFVADSRGGGSGG